MPWLLVPATPRMFLLLAGVVSCVSSQRDFGLSIFLIGPSHATAAEQSGNPRSRQSNFSWPLLVSQPGLPKHRPTGFQITKWLTLLLEVVVVAEDGVAAVAAVTTAVSSTEYCDRPFTTTLSCQEQRPTDCLAEKSFVFRT